MCLRALWRANADLIVGRQPVSWATTLFLTPADPFSPFDPADPFREYRGGVDAARLRVYRVLEVQRDGLGATSPAGLLAATASRVFSQGEMQVLGREVGAVQVSYTLHPLVSASGLVLGNFRDRERRTRGLRVPP